MAVDRRADRRADPRRTSDRTLLDTALDAVARSRRDQRKALRRAAIGYLILLIGCFFGALALEHRTDARLRSSQLRACERLNLQRERINNLQIIAWRAWDDGIQRERKLAAAGPDRAVHLRSVHNLQATEKLLTTQALTNCNRAVDTPDTYIPPPLVHINGHTPLKPIPLRPVPLAG